MLYMVSNLFDQLPTNSYKVENRTIRMLGFDKSEILGTIISIPITYVLNNITLIVPILVTPKSFTLVSPEYPVKIGRDLIYQFKVTLDNELKLFDYKYSSYDLSFSQFIEQLHEDSLESNVNLPIFKDYQNAVQSLIDANLQKTGSLKIPAKFTPVRIPLDFEF